MRAVVRRRKMDRENAEKHWEYTEKIIMIMLKLVHLVYVEAMLHGSKHTKEEKDV